MPEAYIFLCTNDNNSVIMLNVVNHPIQENGRYMSEENTVMN